jgi:hypothetical protein
MREGGFGGYALGAGLGSILWNGIFLGLSAIGILDPEMAWLCIKVIYFAAAAWVVAGILNP